MMHTKLLASQQAATDGLDAGHTFYPKAQPE